MSYFPGDLIRVEATFRDEDGELADPGTVTFKARRPNGSILSHALGVDPDTQRESEGVFSTEWHLDTGGRWYFRVESAGAVQAAEETSVRVISTAFDGA
jgi:hypothetical protein